jgi:hypothetical protein
MVNLLIALIVIGVVLYILQQIPMDARIKGIITVLVVAVVAIWAIRLLLGGGGGGLLALP